MASSSDQNNLSQNNKVLWGEGLFLRPQHFQQQDQYHDTQRAEAIASIHPYITGVRQVKLDLALLASNTLAFTQLSIIFSDGSLYWAPERDLLPDSQQLNQHDLGDHVDVYVELDIMHLDGSNLVDKAHKVSARYEQHYKHATDLFTNAVSSEVAVIRKKPRISLGESSVGEGTLSLKVARLRRTTSGIYEQDDEFIPSIVTVGASPILHKRLKRLINVVGAKAKSLYDHHRQASQELLEFRSGDVASFWLMHTLNGGYSALKHLHDHPDFHPERLHEQLQLLASQLITFSSKYSLDHLPVYDHAAPMKSMVKLDTMVRDLLNTVISSKYLSIALTEDKPSYYVGKLSSDKINAYSRLYLAVSSSMPAHDVIATVPMRVKAGTPDDVEKLVLSAMPGISLAHVPQVPSAIPVRPGFTYFAVEAIGDLYDKALKAESICLYVPAGFDNLKLELIAIVQ